jgi:hypothetical protein
MLIRLLRAEVIRDRRTMQQMLVLSGLYSISGVPYCCLTYRHVRIVLLVDNNNGNSHPPETMSLPILVFLDGPVIDCGNDRSA